MDKIKKEQEYHKKQKPLQTACKPWFNAVHKSGTEPTKGIYQGAVMGEIVDTDMKMVCVNQHLMITANLRTA